MTGANTDCVEEKTIASHIDLLIEKFRGVRIVVIAEKNLDKTRVTHLQGKLCNGSRGLSVTFMRCNKDRNDKTPGVTTGEFHKNSAVNHLNLMLIADRVRLWDRFFSITPETHKSHKDSLLAQLAALEYTSSKRAESAMDDTPTSVSGKRHGPDDIAISTILGAFWGALSIGEPSKQFAGYAEISRVLNEKNLNIESNV
jgi:hypothetical protein